jgi:hypothetical protein
MINFAAALDEQPTIQPQKQYADPLDLTPVKERLAAYDPKIEEMQAQAEALQVEDDQSNEQAVAMAGQAKQINRKIEKARKGFVEEPNRFVKAVNSLAKSYQSKFTAIENGLKRKITDFQRQQEIERRKREAEAKRQAEEAQKKLKQEAQKAGVEAPKVEAPAMPEQPTATRTEYGAAHQRKVWTYEIQEESQIPREYLVVDQKKIRQAVKDGIREIPGVKIYQDTQTVIR